RILIFFLRVIEVSQTIQAHRQIRRVSAFLANGNCPFIERLGLLFLFLANVERRQVHDYARQLRIISAGGSFPRLDSTLVQIGSLVGVPLLLGDKAQTVQRAANVVV